MKIIIYENYKSRHPDLRSHALTDALIIDALKECGFEAARVQRDENGKPYVIFGKSMSAPCREHERIYVSASHCENVFACAVSDKNCGIDIQIPRNTDYEKIARRYFAPEEQALLEDGKMGAFYVLWTRKEAYAKYTGEGLGQVLRGTSVVSVADVKFDDTILENGMYCSVCTGAP